MFSKKLSRIVCCILAAGMTLSVFDLNTRRALAVNRIAKENNTLYFWSADGDAKNGGLAVTCCVVDVYLSETETYSVSGNKVTYTKRNTYAYARPLSGNWSSIYTTPASYYSKKNKIVTEFTYKKEDGIFPGDAKYVYCKKSGKDVTLSKNTGQFAKAILIVSQNGALVPTQAISTVNSLSVC